MNKGKATCEILKGIRFQIAKENGITYKSDDCQFEGNCNGTCSKCEADILYIEKELVKQKKLGKAVVILGISVGILGNLFGNEREPIQVLKTSNLIKINNSTLYQDSIPKNNDFEKFWNNLNDTLNKYYIEPVFMGDLRPDKSITDLEFDRNEIYKVDLNRDVFNNKIDNNIEIKIQNQNVNKIEIVNKERPKYKLLNINFSDLGIDTNEVYFYPEKMPSFQGGEIELQKYLKNNIQYPNVAKNLGIYGIVIVGFIINIDGTLSNIKILKYVYPELNTEAIRVIEKSPNWNPGIQNGKPVRVYYAIPIHFSLD